jgi:O-acetyl-ADP-ribose deacetylase (regulator of RNase III)
MIDIEIIQGDITKLKVDAIVNAANCSLLGGGGVDGAIHRAAGPELLQACIPLNGCETGQAKITPGFRLPAKFVIHTPGPIYGDGKHGEPELLESCYKNCLALAEENNCETVAFPAISCGVYGYPWEAATEIAVKTVRNFPAKNVKKVIFCCFGERMEAVYKSAVGTH